MRELTSGFNAIHAGHGDISQHDIRRIVRRMFDGVCALVQAKATLMRPEE